MPSSSSAGRVLGKLSYILASRSREKVLAAVIPGPKTSVQLGRQTNLRLPHVSRTLRQLEHAGLVRPTGQERRGRLYLPTPLGEAVFRELAEARGDRLIAPLIRGTHFRNYHHWVAKKFGRNAADELLIEVGLDPARLDADGWYPLRAALDALQRIENRFGDGTHDVVRRMLREESSNYGAVRRLLSRVLPFPLLIELAPSAYNREFNHGRLEVDVKERRALLRNYDWMSSPARCAAWQGVYEGALDFVGVEGRVTKVACILKGSAYCGYEIEW